MDVGLAGSTDYSEQSSKRLIPASLFFLLGFLLAVTINLRKLPLI